MNAIPTRGQQHSGSTHQGLAARVRFDGIVADTNNRGSGDLGFDMWYAHTADGPARCPNNVLATPQTEDLHYHHENRIVPRQLAHSSAVSMSTVDSRISLFPLGTGVLDRCSIFAALEPRR